MRNFRLDNTVIVVLFALLHFAVAAISRALNYYDDIPLTILTIAMVIIIAMRNNTRVDMMAVLTLVATIIGFVIGSWLWHPMQTILNNDTFAPAVSTLLITTILGLGVNSLTIHSKRLQARSNAWRTSTSNVIAVAASILFLRLIYVITFRTEIFTEGTLLESISNILSNTWAVLLLLLGNIILTIRPPKIARRGSNKATIATILAISLTLISLLVAAITYYDIPKLDTPATEGNDFVRFVLAAILLNILTITICILVQLSTTSTRKLREERELKHRSEYQYERLKQQINPHFLFNSLGILDYLVQEHETERASSFIRKLANMYRYMLNNDNKPLVKISEELEFTQMYTDLLKERFTEGMVVEIAIPKEYYDRQVVPCALQLLVENATKHNIVSAERPLTINITIEEEYIVVKNRLQLRTHGQPSTRLGLENIRRQYLDITRRDIVVQKTDNEFIVKLPII